MTEMRVVIGYLDQEVLYMRVCVCVCVSPSPENIYKRLYLFIDLDLDSRRICVKGIAKKVRRLKMKKKLLKKMF